MNRKMLLAINLRAVCTFLQVLFFLASSHTSMAEDRVCICPNQSAIDNAYESALTCLDQENYGEALEHLYLLGSASAVLGDSSKWSDYQNEAIKAIDYCLDHIDGWRRQANKYRRLKTRRGKRHRIGKTQEYLKTQLLKEPPPRIP